MTDPLIFQSRPPGSFSDRTPLVILLHGLGSDEQDLISLADYMDPDALVTAPRAPLPYSIGGFRWFDFSIREGVVDYSVEEALVSLELVRKHVEAIQSKYGIGPERTVLGGFSQGAVMTLAVVTKYPTLVKGGLMMSGALTPELVSPTTDDLRRVKLLVQHGRFDPVLPIPLGRALRDYLEDQSLDFTYKEYPMAHEISRESLGDALAWLSAQDFH